MTDTLITTGIDALTAEADPAGGWRLSFRSPHAGAHHQLYVNGRLADATDTPDQRSFHLDPDGPALVAVAAVPAERRWEDLWRQLPPEALPSWVYRPRVLRSPALAAGDVVEVLGDHAAGGAVDESPLASAAAWPAWASRWSFGQDLFGGGAFGWDGALAPGLGEGAFGGGPFGLDADLIDLSAELAEEGAHAIVLRTRSPDGTCTDAPQPPVTSAPPPAPPTGLAVESYDPPTGALTLSWSLSPDDADA